MVARRGDAAGDYCEALADFKASSNALDAWDDATPEQLEAAFTDLDETLDPLVAAAPDEITADVELLAATTASSSTPSLPPTSTSRLGSDGRRSAAHRALSASRGTASESTPAGERLRHHLDDDE